MTYLHKKRLFLVSGILLAVIVAAFLAMKALNQNINLYFTPIEVKNGNVPIGQRFRIGGMVVKGSVKHSPRNLETTFLVTDYQATVPIVYNGILPDLFKEGQGVVVTGQLNPSGQVKATDVLAKHDEKYMPREVKYAIKSIVKKE
jgi:cytochrome c-type biogenesis protein CcmE